MASEFAGYLSHADLQRETDAGADPLVNLVLAPGEASQSGNPAGDIRGVSLPKYKTAPNLAKYGYTGLFRIPANLTLGTGLTFKAYLTDDGANANDLGKVVKLGVTLKRLAADATDDIDQSAATEVTGTVTLSANSGGICIGSIAIANASLPSGTVVGDLLMMRIRRVSTDTSDTAPGRVILLGVAIQNT